MDLVKLLRERHEYYMSGLTEKQNSLMSLAADEIERLRNLLQNGSPVVEGTIQHMALRITELEAVIKSHGIPVKTYSGGVAHYCMKEEV